jgi:cytochrome c peroxidase
MNRPEYDHVQHRPAPRPARVSTAAICAAALAAILVATARAGAPAPGRSVQPTVRIFPDATGAIETLDVNGRFNRNGAFFQSLGTNGRTCETCHAADQAMSLEVRQIQARFAATHGKDPLFAPVDGANCPNARRGHAADHSLLLKHGLIRVSMALPANAQFTITVVHDPYGCAIVPDPNGGEPVVSVYRRPLPTTNLSFLSAIMFDGRETIASLSSGTTFLTSLTSDLTHQALDAINGHAQAITPPTAGQLADIVDFELGLVTAQARDHHAGSLRADGAYGGVMALSALQYYPGINDPLGTDPTGAAFNPANMMIFSNWSDLDDRYGDFEDNARDAARRAIAAGEAIFNSAPVQISNVRGLNDNAALGKPGTFTGHCATCHNTPNVGNHSLPLPLDIGTGHAVLAGMEPDPNIAAALSELSMPDLPVYLIQGCPNPFHTGQPESFYTTDPAKALVTGLCSDFNRGKGPVLRGLAARAPYFHNGAAANLHELVNFYDRRFAMGLTEEQKHDLVAFLNSL